MPSFSTLHPIARRSWELPTVLQRSDMRRVARLGLLLALLAAAWVALLQQTADTPAHTWVLLVSAAAPPAAAAAGRSAGGAWRSRE